MENKASGIQRRRGRGKRSSERLASRTGGPAVGRNSDRELAAGLVLAQVDGQPHAVTSAALDAACYGPRGYPRQTPEQIAAWVAQLKAGWAAQDAAVAAGTHRITYSMSDVVELRAAQDFDSFNEWLETGERLAI